MGDASAYESLGLSPGADQEAIERAYKKLIKEHHPDREGGNSARAAEINRAYRELRLARPSAPDALELNDVLDDHRRRTGWILPLVLLACAAVALGTAYSPVGSELQDWAPVSAQPHLAKIAHAQRFEAMDEPLQKGAIASAVREAKHIATTRDEMSLAAESNDCHRQLKTSPDLVQLDHCAAFDDAVVELQDRDPLRDRGPFSELAVTGRQWSSASTLSNDYLAIDGRLDRIRLQVQLALAEAPQPAAD